MYLFSMDFKKRGRRGRGGERRESVLKTPKLYCRFPENPWGSIFPIGR